MRKFIKSLAGKTILFIVCIISVITFLASTAGIIIVSQNTNIYSLSEKDYVQSLTTETVIVPFAKNALLNGVNGYDYNMGEAEYQITDIKGKVISSTSGLDKDGKSVYRICFGGHKDQFGDFQDLYYLKDGVHSNDGQSEYYIVSLRAIEGSSFYYDIRFFDAVFHTVYSLRYIVYVIALASLLLAIVCFVALMYASGRRADSDELVAGPLHKVPFDLMFVLALMLGLISCIAIAELISFEPVAIACFVVWGLVVLSAALGLCMSTASRIKQHTLIKNTLIRKIHCFNMSLIRGIPLIWRTGLIFIAISALEAILIICSDGEQEVMLALWLIEKIILLPVILYIALSLRRLQKSGAALANGDLSYHTDTKGMFWDFKKHGENLNKIAGGMSIAVEDRLKSERMKTELITNVSHDIKTPLTSIINYASLISEEKSENEKITEYSSVLVRQSEKLKRLIEDLVEASKASTGNLDVALAPCDAGTFLTQAGGEYEDKMKQADLALVTKLPEKELRIMADGRRMWRVFDNLMNNVCKYALPGTRVYLTLEEKDGHAVVTFKNTSREPLDMTEEELMERFTRGDSSRNTEGNGLGLAIAKSMAELQGGELRLATDGDLFKATLSFPLIH